MKTLLITLEYPPFKGGVANYYSNLAKYWPLEERIQVLDNARESLLSTNSRFSWLKTVSVLVKEIRTRGFDYLLVGQILPLGTAAWLATFIKPFKYGVILHGLDFNSALESSHKRFLAKLILKKADKIICANSRLAELVKNFNGDLANKIKIVNPGIDPIISLPSTEGLNNLQDTYNLKDYFVLFTLGRLVLRKGVDSVIKAMSNWGTEDLKIKYFIAGSGKEEKYLRSLAAVSPLSESIIFLGELTEEEKWLWLHACDLFVMPVREIGPDFEGFGIVYLEANLAGKLVLAGNSGGVKDAVEDGINGFLVNPENIEEIRNKIIELKNNRNLLLELGENAKKRAVDKFNWEGQARRLCEIIKE
ncbi:MAG: glycosyltransferase family 4 protein [Patescibacteria group bacterium]